MTDEKNSSFLRELRNDLEQVAVEQAPQPRSRRTALMLSAAATVVALGVVGSLALQPDDTRTVATSPDQEPPLEEPEPTTSIQEPEPTEPPPPTTDPDDAATTAPIEFEAGGGSVIGETVYWLGRSSAGWNLWALSPAGEITLLAESPIESLFRPVLVPTTASSLLLVNGDERGSEHPVYEFNIVDQTWSPLAGAPQPAVASTSDFASTGSTIVTWSSFETTHYEYIVATDEWTARTPPPLDQGPDSRLIVSGERLYALTGVEPSTLQIAFRNLSSDSWTRLPDLPIGVWPQAAVAASGSGLVVWGGDESPTYSIGEATPGWVEHGPPPIPGCEGSDWPLPLAPEQYVLRPSCDPGSGRLVLLDTTGSEPQWSEVVTEEAEYAWNLPSFIAGEALVSPLGTFVGDSSPFAIELAVLIER